MKTVSHGSQHGLVHLSGLLNHRRETQALPSSVFAWFGPQRTACPKGPLAVIACRVLMANDT
jgi:hypothetical protein